MPKITYSSGRIFSREIGFINESARKKNGGGGGIGQMSRAQS